MCVHIVSASKLLTDMFSNICGSCGCRVGQTVSSLTQLEPVAEDDLVLYHVPEPEGSILSDIHDFRVRQPNLRLIMVAGRGLPRHVQDLLSPQMAAIIDEDQSAKTLMATLTMVQEGYRIVRMNGEYHQRTSEVRTPEFSVPDDDTSGLSERERTILGLLRNGVTNKAIANRLGIQEATVKVHLRACYRKIGAKNRTQAAIWASERLSEETPSRAS
ncbi:DNA-binding NarL/FixJ family response regulator [Donghicola tyrosinivorans]|uniref:DNA-binding NarL/FixJ family response regulator n=2 Tax=Donghicola tyrosinivorans TaxID=1652492 RepID=A0A2T0WXT8_9RHOB|nr:DNA-binding NarL/FixJ family response regulator [Donghicola tyrosinivorans]